MTRRKSVIQCRAKSAPTGSDGTRANYSLLKKELAPIMAAKWDRLIPCHGDVIETGARAEWDKVWARFA